MKSGWAWVKIRDTGALPRTEKSCKFHDISVPQSATPTLPPIQPKLNTFRRQKLPGDGRTAAEVFAALGLTELGDTVLWLRVSWFSLFSGAYAIARRSGLLDTSIGGAIFTSAYGQYKKRVEDPFDGLIRRHPSLFKGGHIVDAGANIGYCSKLFASVIEPGFSVFAFEPEPFNVGLLNRTCSGREALVPVQAAVGEREGEVRLKLNPSHHGDHRVAISTDEPEQFISVPMVTIDGFLARRRVITPVSFIKIDIQGYEPAMCRGAEQTLTHNLNCSVALEYTPGSMVDFGFSPDELPVLFNARGYRTYTIHKDGHLTPGLADDVGKRGYVDLLFTRREL